MEQITSPGYKTSCLGRAELVAMYGRFGKEGLLAMAELSGFKIPETRREKPADDAPRDRQETRQTHREKQATSPQSQAAVVYYRVCGYTARKKTRRKEPDWYKKARPFNEAALQEEEKQRKSQPPAPPLVPWSRLWPWLKKALATEQATNRLDEERAVRELAECRQVATLPLRRRWSWAPACQVILDCNKRLALFWQDMHLLLGGIKKIRGRAGLSDLVPLDKPGGPVERYHRPGDLAQPYSLPETGTPLLVVSDLGMLADSGSARAAWLDWGRRLRRRGLVPLLLTPLAVRQVPGDLAAVFQPVCWDLRRTPGGGEPVVETLLSLLAVTVRVEPCLLRGLRLLLAGAGACAATEAAVWNHPAVRMDETGLVLREEERERYGAILMEKCRQQPELADRLLQVLKTYHEPLPASILITELILCETFTGLKQAEAQKFLARCMQAVEAREVTSQAELRDWWQRVFRRMPPAAWRQHEALGAAWVLLHREELEQHKPLDIPLGLDLNKFRWIWQQQGQNRMFELRQRGPGLQLAPAGMLHAWRQTAPLLQFTTPYTSVQIEKLIAGQLQAKHEPLLREGALELGAMEKLRLETESATWDVEGMPCPEWAAGMGEDEHGLYALVGADEEPEKVYWQPPGEFVIYVPEENKVSFDKGFFWQESAYKTYQSHRTIISRLGKAWEADEYGIYLQIDVRGVPLRMRWIWPGEFLMGSPEEEPGRNPKLERQHKVILTGGFWLAETACTQELWQAVMGNNPAYFKGSQLPVETVSWDDCLEFIGKINTLVPGLQLRLPTEAEWEYACRAGTTTPFSFGKDITPSQVNYDGNYPYSGREKGVYREKTVPVKSLPPNGWGLYEMHGNVWEWCADWYAEYPEGTVSDPVGPGQGENRVVRGGCWVYSARDVRSACRDWFMPDLRNLLGFRLARGHQPVEQAGEQEKKSNGQA